MRRCGPSTAPTSPRRSISGRCRRTAPRCWSVPGQDAGAVDVGDGFAAVFKMESHSHPSAIEPYQGAATGVGGIVRDIVSMGARPVALLDPLMFGPLEDERNRWLLEGVVAGIGGYGNCIGVPTVGGEVRFAEPHSANPTVNVLCVGIARADRLMTAATHTPSAGSLMVLYGATTGRDGIGGVSVLASATIEEGSEGSRPSVQIGDPFAEKLLIEASLELVEEDLLEGLQDLGGAGLTCAVSESAARSGLRRAAGPRRRAAARAGDGGVRDPDVGVAGADARDRASFEAGPGPGGVREVGARDGGRGHAGAGWGPGRQPRRRAGREGPGAVAHGEGARVRASDAVDPGRTATTPRSRRSTAISATRSGRSWQRPTWRPSDGSSSSTTGWCRGRPSPGRARMRPSSACRER